MTGGGGMSGAGGRLPDSETVGPIAHGKDCRGRDYPGGGATGGAVGHIGPTTKIDFSRTVTERGRYEARVKLGARELVCVATLPVTSATPKAVCTAKDDGGSAYLPELTWASSQPFESLVTDLVGLRLSWTFFEPLQGLYGGQPQPLPPAIEIALSRDGTMIANAALPLKLYCEHFGHFASVRGDDVVLPVAP